MSNEIAGKRVAFLVANEGVEQVELTEPWKAVQAGGGTPTLVSVKPGQVQAFNHLDKGDTFPVDETVDGARPATTTRWCCRAASRTRTSCAPSPTRSRSRSRSWTPESQWR